MERFVKEYANYLIKKINDNDLLNPIYANESIETIHKTLSLYEKGYITNNETMKTLANVY